MSRFGSGHASDKTVFFGFDDHVLVHCHSVIVVAYRQESDETFILYVIDDKADLVHMSRKKDFPVSVFAVFYEILAAQSILHVFVIKTCHLLPEHFCHIFLISGNSESVV